jgi:8-oxo-dGTP pyrophosphatase MutT (NUDIX family)
LYKIYFDDKPLFLTDRISAEIEPFSHHDDTVLIDELSTPAIHSILHEMHQPKVHAGIFLHPDVEELKKAIWKKFTVIRAAGTLTVSEKENVLFIYRRGKWDLPKGKCEEGEEIDTCAIRETMEETGLSSIHLNNHLLNTYHTYTENGKAILKETYWYKCTAKEENNLTPQEEEQITKIVWASGTEIHKLASETYPSIKDVLAAGGYL